MCFHSYISLCKGHGGLGKDFEKTYHFGAIKMVLGQMRYWFGIVNGMSGISLDLINKWGIHSMSKHIHLQWRKMELELEFYLKRCNWQNHKTRQQCDGIDLKCVLTKYVINVNIGKQIQVILKIAMDRWTKSCWKKSSVRWGSFCVNQ